MLVGNSARFGSKAVTVSCRACQQQRRLAHKLVEVELLEDVAALGRRGQRLAVAPGRARNQLLPRGQALLVVDGKGSSPLRDMLARTESLAQMLGDHKVVTAKQVLDQLQHTPEAPLSADEATLSALSLLPQPLEFARRTQASEELFGSVSLADIVAEAREFGIRLEESQCTFVETDGVEKGRIKRIGDYTVEIRFKSLERTEMINIRVKPE